MAFGGQCRIGSGMAKCHRPTAKHCETAAHQLRNMSPDQRAMALAQLGLPRHAFAIIERLARRLVKSLENDIPPDLVVGFLIALLTTLGHVSDALRYVDSILRNTDAG